MWLGPNPTPNPGLQLEVRLELGLQLRAAARPLALAQLRHRAVEVALLAQRLGEPLVRLVVGRVEREGGGAVLDALGVLARGDVRGRAVEQEGGNLGRQLDRLVISN